MRSHPKPARKTKSKTVLAAKALKGARPKNKGHRAPMTLYESICSVTKRLSFPPPWEDFECPELFREITCDLERELPDWLERFSVSELIEAGLVCADAADKPRLRASLVLGQIIAILRTTSGAQCRVVSQISLTGTADDLLATLADPRLPVGDITDPFDYAVTSIVDWALLWTLGLCAVPASGLASLGREQLDILVDRWGWRYDENAEDSEADDAEEEDTPSTFDPISEMNDDALNADTAEEVPTFVLLVLVDWSPVTLTPIAREVWTPVADRFHRVSNALNLDVSEVRVWRCSDANAGTIRTYLTASSQPRQIVAHLEFLREPKFSMLTFLPWEFSAPPPQVDQPASFSWIDNLEAELNRMTFHLPRERVRPILEHIRRGLEPLLRHGVNASPVKQMQLTSFAFTSLISQQLQHAFIQRQATALIVSSPTLVVDRAECQLLLGMSTLALQQAQALSGKSKKRRSNANK